MVNNLLLYGTPVMANPTKAYILMTQEPTEKMPKKWIKAIFTKPLVILKSIYFHIFGINQDLATTSITGECITLHYRKVTQSPGLK
jgi:hypothetical protein